MACRRLVLELGDIFVLQSFSPEILLVVRVLRLTFKPKIRVFSGNSQAFSEFSTAITIEFA